MPMDGTPQKHHRESTHACRRLGTSSTPSNLGFRWSGSTGTVLDVLPALIAHLPGDRERLGLRPVQMAGRLHLTYRQYLALEAGEMELHDYELVMRIWDVCGWPQEHSQGK